MATPHEADWIMLKRIGRYLKHAPRICQLFQWQVMAAAIKTFTDSDWAGCKVSCKSTSAGVVTLGSHTLKMWSSTQSVIALSSAEAELYAMVKGAAQTLGMMTMAVDFGLKLNGKVDSDASAAIAIVHRHGLGKLRHINDSICGCRTKSVPRSS